MSLFRRNPKGIRPVFVTVLLGLLLVLVAACSTCQEAAQSSPQSNTNSVAQVNQVGLPLMSISKLEVLHCIGIIKRMRSQSKSTLMVLRQTVFIPTIFTWVFVAVMVR